MQPRMQYEVENLNKLPLNQADLEEMNSKESTYRRISALGKLVVECQAQAVHYGTCVSQKDNITKYACDKEFQALKACIKQATKKTKP